MWVAKWKGDYCLGELGRLNGVERLEYREWSQMSDTVGSILNSNRDGFK